MTPPPRSCSAYPAHAGCSGCNRNATRVRLGEISLKISSHLPAIAVSKCVKPVMLPPGCVRLATSPISTGAGTVDENQRHRARLPLSSHDRGRRCGRGSRPVSAQRVPQRRHAFGQDRQSPPSDSRPGRCGRRPSPAPEALAEGPLGEPAPLDRPARLPLAHRSAASDRSADRAPRAAMPAAPLSRRDDLSPPCMSGKEHSEG